MPSSQRAWTGSPLWTLRGNSPAVRAEGLLLQTSVVPSCASGNEYQFQEECLLCYMTGSTRLIASFLHCGC